MKDIVITNKERNARILWTFKQLHPTTILSFSRLSRIVVWVKWLSNQCITIHLITLEWDILVKRYYFYEESVPPWRTVQIVHWYWTTTIVNHPKLYEIFLWSDRQLFSYVDVYIWLIMMCNCIICFKFWRFTLNDFGKF